MAELGLAASHREIGATVARLFDDVRRETSGTIEAKPGARRWRFRSRPATGTGETPTGRRAGAPASARLALGVVAVVGLIAVVAICRVAARRRVAAESLVPAAAPAPMRRPCRPRRPRMRSAPRDEAATPGRPRGHGHRDQPPAARPGRRRSGRHRRASPLQSRRQRPRRPRGGRAGAGTDCAHPFFVDADGIKRFRPECM